MASRRARREITEIRADEKANFVICAISDDASKR
jgi:hypothetical protein